MKRRDYLKSVGLGSLGLVGLSPQVAAAETFFVEIEEGKKEGFEQFGRTDFEKKRDEKLFAEAFFTKNELKTIGILAEIIIPKDGRSGSATDAGAVEFIEFMAKDKPQFQTPLRGGLAWLDAQSNRRFGQIFVEISAAQRIEIVEDIAFPERKVKGMSQGVAFFSLMRNLTASAFWSSKIGHADLGYVGNTPNEWDGPPADVVAQYGLAGIQG